MLCQKLLNAFSQSDKVKLLLSQLGESSEINFHSSNLTASALIASIFIQKGDQQLVCVLENEALAKSFFEDLLEFLGKGVYYYPAIGPDMLRELGPTANQVGRRLSCIRGLLKRDFSCLVLPADALLEKVAPPEDVELYRINLKYGDSAPLDQFIKQLVEMGYVREERVDAPGEFCVRGGLVDIFLFEEQNPFRIEFFGDEVESIRIFDVESQRSIEKCDGIEILPLGSAGPYGPIDERTEYDLPLKSTLFDFLPQTSRLWLQNKRLVLSRIEAYEREASIRLETLQNERRFEDISFAELYTGYKAVEAYCQKQLSVDAGATAGDEQSSIIHFDVLQNSHFGGNLKLFHQELKHVLAENANAYIGIACDSMAQRNRLDELFSQEGFPQNINISTLAITQGISWPDANLYVYTNREIYSRVRLAKIDRFDKRTVSFREQLSIHKGDYVVHEEFGLGVFVAVEKITAYGTTQECLKIEYQDGDLLFVPLEKMDQIQKYSSSDGAVPVLNKLGSLNWEKLKKRTKKRMKEIASELIKLYAARKSRAGFSFSDDTVWQKELEVSFQFEETRDQLAAINDVKEDMQQARPMDRLICGDVGYGKTEVAVRAAFKAISEGKQVAVLAPTTILAQQHYDTFSERLGRFPVAIGLLSRFKTPKQQKDTLEKAKSGNIDLVVGTHRLLSKDVQFKDLGLLVVDEEQKFGVMHKEKLKLLKQTVDTLTLSATPIPRTMHMALMGAKDMSIINSPPQNRLPVKTEVSRFDRDLIRTAILRELDRGGQVFFVHNRVQSIYGIAALLNELIPEAATVVAHGRMKGHELEKAMLKFVSGKAHILVSTMIIENGIDLPKANTLIINRADKLGLAQLYQLRGRVGRSDRQAYAYLLIPPARKLTRDAIKRLQTIQEHSELGAGYKIAMRDLEIRGAGNIFGAEQTGFVNALGYELYTKIIKEAVSEIRTEFSVKDELAEQEAVFDVNIECKIDAYIPDDYVTSAVERVDIYRRLVSARTEGALVDVRKELLDRFGKLPQQAENLIEYIQVKNLASLAKIERLKIHNKKLIGTFNNEFIPKGKDFRPWLGAIVANAPNTFELSQESNNLVFEMDLSSEKNDLVAVRKFLQKII